MSMPRTAALPIDNIPQSNSDDEKGSNGIEANGTFLGKHESSDNKDTRILMESTPVTDDPERMDETSSTSEDPSDPDADEEENNEDEEQDEDEEAEDDDEDEEEPALKYERISGFLPDMFKKDSASALAMSNETMVCAR